MLPGAKAPHFNYVGDSIVGHGVNLGAGVKLSTSETIEALCRYVLKIRPGLILAWLNLGR